MFVVQEHSDENQNKLFTISRVPMGSVSERSQFILRSVLATLKGAAHTNFFNMQEEKVVVNPVAILNRITLTNEEPEVREALRAMMDSYFIMGDFTQEQRIDTYLVFQDLDILIQEIFEWKRTFNTAENRN